MRARLIILFPSRPVPSRESSNPCGVGAAGPRLLRRSLSWVPGPGSGRRRLPGPGALRWPPPRSDGAGGFRPHGFGPGPGAGERRGSRPRVRVGRRQAAALTLGVCDYCGYPRGIVFPSPVKSDELPGGRRWRPERQPIVMAEQCTLRPGKP